MHVSEFHVLFIRGILACALGVNFQCCSEWQLIVHAVSPTPSLPLSSVYSVWWVPVSLSCVGAHGWVIRIFQRWEHTPSRSWLPIVKLLKFFSHLILLCIFSLSSVFFNMSLWQTLPTSSTSNIKLFYSIPRCLGHPTSTWWFSC